ncbi:hypothetical protein EC973_003068 [Apophysomyces ossiformis]|uniref:Gamma-butyrobetaine dioxygenase n=1 Tax=Apophysomyces ossiformis TaxID=679940 RepID=A0A8H7EM80_9FUNG|nr:hypothetical protein EC973_003068 [Apophysomyces ossiformis]
MISSRLLKSTARPFIVRSFIQSTPFRSQSTVAVTNSDQDALHIKTPNGNGTFSYLWLRDNCRCEKCIHPSSRQKLHSSAAIPLDIAPSSVRITGDMAEIVWNKPLRHQSSQDKHISRYPLSFLGRYASRQTCESFRFNHIAPQTWNRHEYKLDWVDYKDYMTTDAGLHKVVQRLYNRGLVFLKGVPTIDNSVTQVAERIGPIQETFYGRDFDVKDLANTTNIAYTSLNLGVHMDLMYHDNPPGIQLLHCLKNSVTGGASTFVDSLRAVELLKKNFPQDYEILKETPVTFHYVNDGHHQYRRRPTIVVGEDHSGPAWDVGVNYAPQSFGPMDHLSPAQTKAFYAAFQRFADHIEDSRLRYEITLQPGQLVMFANRRVLHGRTEFDPISGDRHLKGTYVALDSLKDKLRVLCNKYGYDASV